MTRKQMIGVLEDYCNKNICVSCKLHYACESKKDFSDMTDEEMEDYVSDIKEKNTDKESQNVFYGELVGKKMEPVKTLVELKRMEYPVEIKNIIPARDFVKAITDKGYHVKIEKNMQNQGLWLTVYEEVEM